MAHLAEPRLAAGDGHTRYLVRSALFLLAVAAVAGVLYQPLLAGFSASPLLNGAILATLAFGVAYTLVAMVGVLATARTLDRAGRTVEEGRRGGTARSQVTDTLVNLRPRELGQFLDTVHRVVRQGEATGTLPYLLDSLATRAEDRRALVRFLTGALIILGLLGTFYGLLITIGGVREVLGGLAGEGATDTTALLASLRERLSVPLGGMALAFSSSLFGLSASLVLAFLELQLFHAQSEVQARTESLVVSSLLPFWQSHAPAVGIAAAGPAIPQYVLALLEGAAERMERLARILEKLPDREAGLERLVEATDRLGAQVAGLGKTLERAEADRTGELRSELRLLTRTVAEREAGRAT
jgi:hypothetical protein